MIDFSPGPSQLYSRLPQFLDDALHDGVLSMSHRSAEFAQMYESTVQSLRELMDIPETYHVWFMGSATEAMERVVQNVVEHRSHHFVNGAFSAKFAGVAADLGRRTTQTQRPWGMGFDLLDHDIHADAELIAITQNETSTGTSVQVAEIATLHKRYPDKLLAVDIVSSAPYVQLAMDAVDCVIFSVQKGFGLPAGLGVLIASPRALERSLQLREKGISIGSYHSFPELAAHEAKSNTPETPNVLGIYLLGRVAADMIETGITELRQQLDSRADMLYELIDSHPQLGMSVLDNRHRSRTVIVAEAANGSQPLIEDIKRRGYTIGAGYAHQKTTHIRIANFPAHADHVEDLVAAIRKQLA